MSVFTTVTPEQLEIWLHDYPVGSLSELKGILAGIENTNYFVTTGAGRYVLTLFEKLQSHQLPFYLELMDHLSRQGVRCPRPIANRQGKLVATLNGKPAALVTRLEGAPVMAPAASHCLQVGEALANLHCAGQSYPGHLDNLRGASWWRAVAPDILPFLNSAQQALLQSEIDFVDRHLRRDLPRGVVHADLFRDNVLFDGKAIGG
ncbi:MAG: homoserine kinase, partial [Betaproteobacteria bacterium]|nr:homoserine kinase [Betaproteobacteria bacterium]